MKLGLISDTHDQLERTVIAVQTLKDAGAEHLIHCGDFTSGNILAACCQHLPMHFVFGNNDWGNESELRTAAEPHSAECMEYGGEITLAGRRIAMTHGHLHSQSRPLLAAAPDYLITGHSHTAHDRMNGDTRWINPGALYRASEYSVALLDLVRDELRFITIAR